MATFNVISLPDQLPAKGTRESPMLDFKGELDRVPTTGKPDYFELAKDVASMASVYGGALLLGARGGSQLVEYKPLSDRDAHETCEAYQTAAKDRCVPVPLITTEKIPYDSGFVVAVNVFPVLDRPVAVRVTTIPEDRFGSPPCAYLFPVRLSTHAVPYTPENLPMLLNAQIRRVIILLESIPKDSGGDVRTVAVCWTGYRRSSNEVAELTRTTFQLQEINPERNALVLLYRPNPQSEGIVTSVPLDDVDAVWSDAHQWAIRVQGHFDFNRTHGLYITRIPR